MTMGACQVIYFLATVATLICAALAQPYTLDDVAKHATTTDCWTAISDVVYDLTAFAPTHPIPDSTIYTLCGIDGTTGFLGAHANNPERVGSAVNLGPLAAPTPPMLPVPAPLPADPTSPAPVPIPVTEPLPVPVPDPKPADVGMIPNNGNVSGGTKSAKGASGAKKAKSKVAGTSAAAVGGTKSAKGELSKSGGPKRKLRPATIRNKSMVSTRNGL